MNQETNPETPGRPAPDPDRVSELIRIATELTAEVEDLAVDSGHQFVSLARTARTNRRLIWAVTAGAVINTVLIVILALLGVGVVNNADRIDAVTQRLDFSQTVTRQKVLCPLYQIFVDAESPEAREAAPDKEEYDHNFRVIKAGYNELNCIEVKDETP